jgi:hypothetical protein
MTTNITVKTRIRMNGQDYASAADMPAELREAYERALATVAAGKPDGAAPPAEAGITGHLGAIETRIIVNGHEYRSVDEMPAALRLLYRGVQAAVDTEAGRAAIAVASSGNEKRLSSSLPGMDGAVRPESNRAQLALFACIVGATLFLLWSVFGR